MITAKQYRVAAQHLKQAQESLRLARHSLGDEAAQAYYFGYHDGMHGAMHETDRSIEGIKLMCVRAGVEPAPVAP